MNKTSRTAKLTFLRFLVIAKTVFHVTFGIKNRFFTLFKANS